MNPRVLPCRGTRMKLLKKWHDASCSVGMLRSLVKPSPAGERMNSRAMGDSESRDEVTGDEAALGPPVVAMVATELLRPVVFRCTLRSVARVSLRKTRSKSSLYPGHVRRVLAH